MRNNSPPAIMDTFSRPTHMPHEKVCTINLVRVCCMSCSITPTLMWVWATTTLGDSASLYSLVFGTN